MGLACSQSAEWLWVLRVESLCLKESQVGRLLMWKCLVLFPCCRMCQLLSTENDCNLTETPGGKRMMNLQGHKCSFKSRSSNKVARRHSYASPSGRARSGSEQIMQEVSDQLNLEVERRLREYVECRAVKPSD